MDRVASKSTFAVPALTSSSLPLFPFLPSSFDLVSQMTKIGIVGVGYWGPNLVRCFDDIADCEVVSVCDLDPASISKIRGDYPDLVGYSDIDLMMASEDLDAVAIATPPATHYSIALKALQAGLNVIVEKPLTINPAQGEELIRIANKKNLVLFVGHIFLYSSPVRKLREIISSGELGDISHVSCKRLNFGPVRTDVNSLYDLATHDISILLYLLGLPTDVWCHGLDQLQSGVHDVVSLNLKFPNNIMGLVHCSWLEPCKERAITIVGKKKMVVYDDLASEQIRIYDRQISLSPSSDHPEILVPTYHQDGVTSPKLETVEPLRNECLEFIRCVTGGGTPLTDGLNGLEVLEVLNAANTSLMDNGKRVPIDFGRSSGLRSLSSKSNNVPSGIDTSQSAALDLHYEQF